MQYSKNEINKVGEILKDRNNHTNDEILYAETVLTDYRIAHAAIINTFQANLRKKLKDHKLKSIVAQRLKRQTSIVGKLMRENSMNLSRMQDIAGVRVIFKNLKELNIFKNSYLASRFKHKLIKVNDYIEIPKKSGYRSVHLIYKYIKLTCPLADGLQIELQLRTKLQHTWATAVETMGTFIDSSLKSSIGPQDILDFFAITSSAFSIIENTPRLSIHNHLTETEIFNEVINRFDELQIESKLAGYAVAANHITKSKFSAKYYLIILNTETRRLQVHNFKKKELELANKEYTEIERSIEQGKPLQAVLISLDTIDSLRKAYPNYFLDTGEFIKQITLIKIKNNEYIKQKLK